MIDPNMDLTELKRRAKAGELQALQELRNLGYFEKKKAEKEGYPVSHAQKRLWILNRMEAESAAYNVPGALLLQGPLQVFALRSALQAVIQRHEILRTTFEAIDSEPRQFIRDWSEDLSFPLKETDLTGDPQAETRARELLREDAGRPFDLTQGWLLRAELLKLTPQRHLFYLNLHHIVCDEWSLNVLLRELSEAYNSAARGSEPQWPPLKLQHKEYAARQEQQLSRPETAAAREYWRRRLSGEPAILNLPTDLPRPAELTHRGANFAFELEPGCLEDLRRLARRSGATLFMALTALTKVLLHRYTDQEEIILGTPIAGREDPDLEDQIGFYVNTLVLRDEIRGEQTFPEALAAVKQTAEEAYEHGGYPFDLLINELNLDRDLSRSPLFDVMIVLEGEESSRPGGFEGLQIEPFDLDFATAKFDLSFYYAAGPDGLRVVLNYNTDLFRPETIARLAGHLKQLAVGITEHPEHPIGRFEMVTGAELRQLLFEFNRTATGALANRTIVTLFEEQAELGPERVAVVSGSRTLTYRELNERANRIAWGLGVKDRPGPDRLVAVLLRPSDWMIATLLGILKAGAAYVPLDPSYPAERLRFMLQDCGARVLITEEACLELARQAATSAELPAPGVQILNVRGIEGRTSNPPRAARPDHAAYVIYTSGSTGRPKGCVVTHRNVAQLMKNDRHYFDFNEHDVWIVAHSFCFDFSVWEMYGALLYGGRVVVPDREAVRDPRRFRQLIKDHRVTVLNQTPAAFHNLIRTESACEPHDLDRHLRYVIFGGDRLEPAELRPWAEWYSPDRVQLINMFGITETTVHVTYHRLRGEELLKSSSGSPIGIPLPETGVYVLNGDRKMQPIGVAGEIYVGGTGVSRGYLNRAELTAERFIENPYLPGRPVYKSGDLGRWLPDGTLEHLGRNDDQVQVRGFRVELHEIEKCLLTHPRIRRALVIAQPTPEGVQELHAYLIMESPAPIDELRRHLQQTLPEYMTPAHFTTLEEFPLTANNKIDYRALPRPGAAASVPGEQFTPPRDRLEASLVESWRRVLNRERIGVFDNYFNLGGDSIKVIRLINAIAAELGIRLEIKDIFRHLTIADLAAELRQRARETGLSTSAQEPDRARHQLDSLKEAILADPDQRKLLPEDWEDFYPMSDIEQGMIFHNLLEDGEGVYHDQFVFQIRDETFDRQRFSSALTLLAQKHSILRTSFLMAGLREPIQIVHRQARIDLVYQEHLGTDREAQKELLQRYLAEDRGRPFDPAEAGLWRMRIFRLAEAEYSLLLIFHHAILDGWSNASLFTELINTYFRLKQETGYLPAPLKATYRDFVADQLRWKQSEETIGYWRRELDRCERLPLPFGKSDVKAGGAKSLQVLRLGPELDREIFALAQAENVSLKDTYLAAFVYLMGLLTGKTDLLFGVVTNNRPAVEDGDAILGCFLNSVPFRLALPASCSPRQLLRTVSGKTRELKAHERLPLRKILELAGMDSGERGGETAPLFRTLFNFIDFHVYERLDDLGRVDTGLVKGFERTDTLFDFSVDGTLGNFSVTIYYSENLFTEPEIERLANYYRRILESFARHSNRALSSSEVLREEATLLLHRFNQAPRDYPADRTIAALFEEQAARTPDCPAVVRGDRRLTYRELNARANALAAALRERHSVQPDDRVAVLLERSEQLIVALLGILKAGGAYVPLDPDFPRQRLEYILNDTGCRCAISSGENLRTLAEIESGLAGLRVAELRDDAPGSEQNPEPVGDGSSLAYVIYTSGSSGRPKGSLIEQRSVSRLVLNTDYLQLRADDRLLQAGSVAFDASTFEIWGALLNGACLVMPEREALLDPAGFRQVMEDQSITVLFLTTSLFNQLAEADLAIFRGLRALLTGGEKVSARHFNLMHEAYPELELLHVYGPTENTTFSTYHLVRQRHEDDVPIGGPIANSTVYVLDRNLQLLPVGVPGEICTGGDGVARGYLNDAELTAQKFVPDPFRPGGRLYRTGDLGRWLPSGAIQFIGRIDQQVKVRGFRVEPGEIEEQMLRHPDVKEAVVLTRATTVGTRELIGYYASREALPETDLRELLEKSLPEYMIPAHLIRLEKMPIKVTGKIDHQALPRPEDPAGRATAESGDEPRDERERCLA
ncbi:MAG TPA: amino acid adenylation domain-containing protein, partial [Blastocatellia bacterium]|nr:amino acid adenylation domain-containing protein [Blastocatellia bacterium]